ncbi:MAG: TetR/AcrR family transcriptional regulator [Phycisphaerales bacterium]|nr:TetR/AcrR family transcriptional regulator [Phycisphaerales bacterium]
MDEASAQVRILDAAERLCQTRGFNGFSFRDLAEIVGIRSASVHYHFPTKADLGKALITRYRRNMETLLEDMERKERTASGRIKRFAGMLREIVRDENRMCLCGILAAESGAISAEMRAELRRFFEYCERWLARQLEAGRDQGEIAFRGAAGVAAAAMLSTLEGAMMTSRLFGSDKPLRDATQWMMAQFAAA